MIEQLADTLLSAYAEHHDTEIDVDGQTYGAIKVNIYLIVCQTLVGLESDEEELMRMIARGKTPKGLEESYHLKLLRGHLKKTLP